VPPNDLGVSEDRADTSAALAKAAREVRALFGDEVQGRLGETLGIVAATAIELGIRVGESVKALLDAQSAAELSLYTMRTAYRCAGLAPARRDSLSRAFRGEPPHAPRSFLWTNWSKGWSRTGSSAFSARRC
jgi:hypothetical protein